MKGRKFLSVLLTAALSLNVVASVAASDVDISSGDALQSGNAAAEVQSVDLPLVENEDLNMEDASGDAIADGVEAGDEDDSEFSDIPEDESDTFTDSATADSEFSSEGATGNMVVGGYIPGDLDYNTPVYDESPYARSAVPATYPVDSTDIEQARAWMNARYPAVRNQNPYGTCWSFATMGLAEFDLINKRIFTQANDLSELQLAHFTYNFVEDPLGGTVNDIAIYNSSDINNSYLNRGGNYEYAVRRLSQWIGAVNEEDVPYSNAASAVTDGLADLYAYDKDVAHLENTYMINIKQNPQAVKEQIIERGAVGIMYTHLPAGVNYIHNTYYDTQNTSLYNGGGHAAMIVGWNDNYPKEQFGSGSKAEKPSADGAWLVRNSWGSGSYNFDYFWMSYETYRLGTTAWAMDFTTADNYDNNYQLDGGVNTYKYLDATTVANVFTVDKKEGVESETLKAVSLSFTHEADVNYTIDIYTDIQQKDYSSDKIWYPPTNGVKQENAGTSGATSYAGVYTIPLEHEVELQPGTVFSVVVTMDKPAMDCEEGYVEGEWNHTVSWYDGYKYKSTYLNSRTKKFDPYKKNFCIKAFTSNNKESSVGDKLYAYSLNLDGAIAINMYMDLPETVVSNQDAYMEFVLPNGKKSNMKVSDARQKDGHYIFTCRVAAKEMAQDVKAKMVVNGQNGQEYTVSVQKYAELLLNNNNYQSLAPLVKSMLNYGAAAQIHFNYHVNELANSIPEMNENDKIVNKVVFQLADKADFVKGEDSGIHWYANSLVLESDTCYRYYFYLDSGNSIDDYSFFCNSVSLNPVEKEINGKVCYYIEIPNIKAQNLADKVEVVVSKTGHAKESMTIGYSAFSYAYDLQQSAQSDDNLSQVTYAMYQYWQLAKQYVDSRKA